MFSAMVALMTDLVSFRSCKSAVLDSAALTIAFMRNPELCDLDTATFLRSNLDIIVGNNYTSYFKQPLLDKRNIR